MPGPAAVIGFEEPLPLLTGARLADAHHPAVERRAEGDGVIGVDAAIVWAGEAEAAPASPAVTRRRQQFVRPSHAVAEPLSSRREADIDEGIVGDLRPRDASVVAPQPPAAGQQPCTRATGSDDAAPI